LSPAHGSSHSAGHSVRASPERIVLHAGRLRGLSDFLIGELVRTLWSEERWPLQQLSQDRLLQVAQLVRSKRAAAQLPGGVTLTVAKDRAVLERAAGLARTEWPPECDEP